MKEQATERLRVVANNAINVHGGKGVQEGPHNYLGSLYRSVPIGITVEGANIVTRSLIQFGQGAIRSHPYLLKEMAALEESEACRLRHFGFDEGVTVEPLHLGPFGRDPIAIRVGRMPVAITR